LKSCTSRSAPYGASNLLPLQERSKQIQQVLSIVANNLSLPLKTRGGAEINDTKTDFVIPVFAGGSGIGNVI
jgi:hypothetical protein